MAPFNVAESDIAALLVEARECSATASNAGLPHRDRVEAAGRYLQAIADLHAAGVPADGVQKVELSLAEEAVRALDPEPLEHAADEIDELLSEVVEDPFQDNMAERADTLMRHLAVRHQAGRTIEGAMLVGLRTELSEEQAEAFDYFESLVRPIMWAMAFANEARVPKLRRIAREKRKASWWWSEGIDIDWRAVQLVTETAEIMARYPAFERYLDKTVRAARARRSVKQPQASVESNEAQTVAKTTAGAPLMEVEFELLPQVPQGKFANIPEVDLGAAARVQIGRSSQGFELRVRGPNVRDVTATDNDDKAMAVRSGRSGLIICALGPELPKSVRLTMTVGDRAVARRITFRRS